MEYLIVCGAAVFVSGVTLFSGFGLGTALMPAFALFFPIPIAVAATAVVHLANNIFKVILTGRNAHRDVIRRFALPAAFAAIIGAAALNRLAHSSPLFVYQIGAQTHTITTIKLMIGFLIVVFACFELIPRLGNTAFERKYLFFGGLLSGFFGGLSGHQGALRAAFLIKAGLSKEAFIGTGAVSAVIVDVSRLFVYGISFQALRISAADASACGMIWNSNLWGLVASATFAAFLGSFLGARLIKKITLRTVQIIVGGMLISAGLGMVTGLF